MSLYTYVDPPNANLICCICRAPFTDPTTARPCAHTFCSECILTALEHAPLCPVDRAPLAPTDLAPADPIVRSLVDELRVECVHRAEGCEHISQRQAMPAHLRDGCPYAEGANETEIEEEEQEDDQNTEAPITPNAEAGCPHAALGCPYTGVLDAHLSTCPYEALQDVLTANGSRMARLTEQNVVLRHRVETLEQTVGTLRREMNAAKAALGPFWKGDSGTLEGTLSELREGVVGATAAVESVGRRGEIALTHETLRLGEEMMSVRAQMHGLRMQVHSLLLERNAAHEAAAYGPGRGIMGSITKL